MTLLRKVYYWWFNSLELKEDNTKEKKARSYSKATERSLCCAAEKSSCCHILSSCSAEYVLTLTVLIIFVNIIGHAAVSNL